MSLKCFLLELMMVIEEQEITGEHAECIFDYNFENGSSTFQADCPPCEAYTLKNITIFLERLNNLLEEMTFSDME